MTKRTTEQLLPGEDLVAQGLADLAEGSISECAFLVLVASPQLERLGIKIPKNNFPRPYEHQLYERIEDRLGTAAHSHYNSLIRRIVSYAHALEREKSRRGNS